MTTFAGCDNGLSTTPGSGEYVTKWEYVYDNLGNRLTKDNLDGGGDITYTMEGNSNNRLSTYTGASQNATYDNNGNTTTLFDARELDYDYTNKIVRATVPSQDRTLVFYDGLGRRVEKEEETYSTSWEFSKEYKYYYDRIDVVGKWHQSCDDENPECTPRWTQKYVFGAGIEDPLEYRFVDSPAEDYYYHEDFVGSIGVVTESGGGLEEGCRYADWGRTTAYDAGRSVVEISTEGIRNTYAYTARRAEEDSSLLGYYFRRRQYLPSLGRFACRDRLSAVRESYAFAANAPALLVDPTGLCPQPPRRPRRRPVPCKLKTMTLFIQHEWEVTESGGLKTLLDFQRAADKANCLRRGLFNFKKCKLSAYCKCYATCPRPLRPVPLNMRELCPDEEISEIYYRGDVIPALEDIYSEAKAACEELCAMSKYICVRRGLGEFAESMYFFNVED